jgi:hypothetical protein
MQGRNPVTDAYSRQNTISNLLPIHLSRGQAQVHDGLRLAWISRSTTITSRHTPSSCPCFS